jgi:hypothetical protein
MPGRHIFIWYAADSHAWQSFFSRTPAYIGTFYQEHNDYVYGRYLGYRENYTVIMGLGLHEYAWNVKAPGAMPWDLLPWEERWKQSEPGGEIYAKILPHVIRNFYGHEAAPEIVDAVSQNVDPRQIIGKIPRRSYQAWVQKSYKSMKWQADRAEKAARSLDIAWNKHKKSGNKLGMSDFAFRRFVYLREVMHSCMWMAKIRAQNLLAIELANKGDEQGAMSAIREGQSLLKQARIDLSENEFEVDLSSAEKEFENTINDLSVSITQDTVPENIVRGFELKIVEPVISEKTFSYGISTVAKFRVELRAGKVLHNVSIRAEAYDSSEQLMNSRELASLDIVRYEWRSQDTFEVEFQQILKKGGVRVLVKSDEGSAEKWLRFGD